MRLAHLVPLLLFIFSLSAQAAPGIIYEVFPRSFQDSGQDGIGDLRGVINRLDYIQDLGADAIWLTPIFASPSYHGYDIVDYMTLNSTYGDLPTLKELISKAHARGMQIILDMPVNCTSYKHPWFIDSQVTPKNLGRDLYIWSPAPLK